MSARPVAGGDAFTFTGTFSQSTTQSEPCPQPTQTTSAAVTQTVTDTATTGPDTNPAVAEADVESDVYQTQDVQTTTTSVLETPSPTKLQLYSTSTQDSLGNVVKFDYSSNPQWIDDMGAAQSWSNSSAMTLTEKLSDGLQITRTTNADGTYSETDTPPAGAGSTETITVSSAAGQGNYAIAGLGTITYAPPASGNITVSFSLGGQSSQLTIPNWFPSWFNGTNLIADGFADKGNVALSSVPCTVPSAVSTNDTQADQLVETYTLLDPVLGYTEQRTTTSYEASGFGPICVQISDVENVYYDYQLDTPGITYHSHNGQPNQVNTITETLALAHASGPGVVQTFGLAHRAGGFVAPMVVAREAAITQQRELERYARLTSLKNFIIHLTQRGKLR